MNILGILFSVDTNALHGRAAVDGNTHDRFRAAAFKSRTTGIVRGCPTHPHVLKLHACRSIAGQALDKPQGRKPRELRHEGRHGALLLYGYLKNPGAVMRGNGSVTDTMTGADEAD